MERVLTVGQGQCLCITSGCSFPCASENKNDRIIIARTWQEIKGTRVYKVSVEVRRIDDDGLEEPLPGFGVPGFGYQGALFERINVVFQSVDNSVDYLQGGSTHRDDKAFRYIHGNMRIFRRDVIPIGSINGQTQTSLCVGSRCGGHGPIPEIYGGNGQQLVA